jgi:hypothetical protein
MSQASDYILGLARRMAPIYAANPRARAILVTGSVAEGLSDYYSDLDFGVYYDELPSEEELEQARRQIGGSERIWVIGSREEGSFAEAYDLYGIQCQVMHNTITAWEQQMAVVLEQLDVASPLQKALSGILASLPLYGEPLVREWQARAAAYPPALARAMVEKHLSFFPIWGLLGQFTSRDATIWRYQVLVEAAQNILAILAGLNRVYYSTFQFKRMNQFVRKLKLAPPNLAERLENLFHSDVETGAVELEKLVAETVALVEQEMPDLDTTAAKRRLGWRQPAWQPLDR